MLYKGKKVPSMWTSCKSHKTFFSNNDQHILKDNYTESRNNRQKEID